MAAVVSTDGEAERGCAHPYGWRDLALYALSLGAGPGDLAYLLEPAPRVLPTWPVIPALEPVFQAVRAAGMDAPHLVHSAQRVEQLRPWPAEGVVTTQSRLQGVFNMRIGALVQVQTSSSVGGELCARTLWSLFVPGVKADDHGRAPPLLRTRPPKDVEPAFSVTWETSPAQALLYRLNGDLNPIHARPATAREAGFERPILHGLCTYGWAAWTALKHLAGDNPARFRRFEARFTRPVLPGHTLVAEGYPLSPGSAAVTVRIQETDELAIAHGLFEYEVD